MTRALIGIVQRTRDGLKNKQAGEEFAPGSERQADKPPGKHVGGAARVEGGQKKKKKKRRCWQFQVTRAGETALTHLSSQTVRTKTYLPAAKAKQECPQKKNKKKKNCGPSQSPKRSRAVLGSVEASM